MYVRTASRGLCGCGREFFVVVQGEQSEAHSLSGERMPTEDELDQCEETHF